MNVFTSEVAMKPGTYIRHLLLLLALCALPLLTGACAGSKKNVAPSSADTARQLRESQRFAGQAQAALAAGEYDRAITLNREALRLNPELGGAWNNMGMALMKRKKDLDYIEAAQCFKRAADLLVTDDRPYENLGVLYHERGFDDESIRYFAMALERNPRAIRSLRGAVIAAKRLIRSDQECLERVNAALMIENDPKWREIFEYERVRIEQDLANKPTNRKTSSR